MGRDHGRPAVTGGVVRTWVGFRPVSAREVQMAPPCCRPSDREATARGDADRSAAQRELCCSRRPAGSRAARPIGGDVAVDPADAPDLSRSQPSRPPTTSDTVTLSFGGDVMFEGDLERLLQTPETGLNPIRAATAEADFTMVNLESALTTRGTPDPKSLEAADNRYHFRPRIGAVGTRGGGGRRRLGGQQPWCQLRREGTLGHAASQVERCAARHRRRPESRRCLHPSSGDPQGSDASPSSPPTTHFWRALPRSGRRERRRRVWPPRAVRGAPRW